MFLPMIDRDGRIQAYLLVDQFHIVGRNPSLGEPRVARTGAKAVFMSRWRSFESWLAMLLVDRSKIEPYSAIIC